MLETQFGKMTTSKREIIRQQNQLEVSLNLSDAHQGKILTLEGALGGGYGEIHDGELRYGGRITFNLIYGSDLLRVETGAEFVFKKSLNYPSGEVLWVRNHLEDVKPSQNGGMLFAVATICTEICIEVPAEVDYLQNIDSLKKCEEFNKHYEIIAKESFELEDEFRIKKIQNVLSSKAVAVVTSAKSANGMVVCEGEVVLTLVLLPFNQNNDILKETRTIPFSFELEAFGALDQAPACAYCEVENLSVKVFVDDEETTKISANFTTQITARTLGQKHYEAVSDAFSCDCHLNLKRQTISESLLCGFISKLEKCEGVFKTNVPENSRFIGAISERCEIVSQKIESGAFSCDVLVFSDLVFVDGEGEIVSTKAELPINIVFNTDYTDCSMASASITSLKAKMRNGKIECELWVRLLVAFNKTYEYKLVCEVNEGEKKEKNNSAISVYLANGGDTEWDVTKALGMSIDEIYSLNPMLEFPLAKNERVICFRQKR